jgi:hypothetical protein
MIERAGAGLAGFLLVLGLATGCTGGQETTAAEESAPGANGIEDSDGQGSINARESLKSINAAIPVYAGARFRDDLTRRDAVTVKSRYGQDAAVYTLATNDSFPQVYHYYTTYLAQFRAFPAQNTYPAERQDWRTLEVVLNEAMQDPFIPGASLDLADRRVILQIVETEAQPRTVIRYIVAPGAPQQTPDATVAGAAVPAEPAAR